MDSGYEARLREALATAQAEDARAFEALESCDAHPLSQEWKSVERAHILATGRVVGINEALNLLTGEETPPNLALLRRGRS
jgi:hypothetical protein